MKYTDLNIQNDDFVLDVGGNPLLLTDRDVIAQDLVHMIRELGFLPPLVGNRNKDLIEKTMVEISIAIDNDERIVPGSTKVEHVELGRFYINAETEDFGIINFFLEV